jgi:proteic killer suppression protein
MIRSFRDRDTERIFRGQRPLRLPTSIRRRAERKLIMLHAATDVNELRVPPGNRLERLKGDRAEQHSIRVKDQWRICFTWRDGDAFAVEITDYHD